MTKQHLPPLQTGASVWYGPEMASRGTEWIIQLSGEEIAELEAAAGRFIATGIPIGQLTHKQFPLPSLGPVLKDLRRQLIRGIGFFLMRGLPVEKYSEREIVTIFFGIGAHLGSARSQNADGHILGHVRDVGARADDPNARIYQTAARQTFHTDSADVVGLLCIREAKEGGRSLLVSAVSIFNRGAF